MRPSKFPLETVKKFFQAHTIATMHELKDALGTTVDMTIFRKLRILGYHTSYSHRGKYYTLDQIAQFDDKGLWSFSDIYFSRHGTLRATAEKFVTESLWGYTVGELRHELHVEVKGTLLDLVRCHRLCREEVDGEYIYISALPVIGRRQIMARGDEQSAALDQLADDGGPVLSHELRAAIILFVSLLDERQRRLWAGLESMRLGHGGDSAIGRLLNVAPQTVAKGRRELLERDMEIERIRRVGGGRPPIKKNAGNNPANP